MVTMVRWGEEEEEEEEFAWEEGGCLPYLRHSHLLFLFSAADLLYVRLVNSCSADEESSCWKLRGGDPRSSRCASLWRCLSALFFLCVCVCVYNCVSLNGRERERVRVIHSIELCSAPITVHARMLFSSLHTCRHLSQSACVRVCVCACVRMSRLVCISCTFQHSGVSEWEPEAAESSAVRYPRHDRCTVRQQVFFFLVLF